LQPNLPAVAYCGHLVPFDAGSAVADGATSDAAPAPDGVVEAGELVSDAASETASE
jgi:hypothetical protein